MNTPENKSKSQNQHRQPFLYLKGFCDEPSFLWVYERERPYNPGKQTRLKFNPCKTGLRKLGEEDAYATVMPDGTLNVRYYEGRNQKIEFKVNDILRKISSQITISIDEKMLFAEYIQNMYWRTKKHENDTLPILDLIQSQSMPSTKDSDYLKSDNGKKFLILESMVTLHPIVHQILTSMSWTFYIAANDSYFVTSSTPVIFDERAGLLKSSLLFPISKNIALIASHTGKPDLEYLNTSFDETIAINYYTMIWSPSIYAPKEEFRIWDFLNNGTRENWQATILKLMPFHAS